MAISQIEFEWKPRTAWTRFHTAVSLHSHTAHSREPLDFMPRWKARHRWMARLAAPYERRFEAVYGAALDWSRVWWTPPLSPRESLSLERSAIVNGLGLDALVSLTDHDSIQAPLLLRVLPEERHTPVSLEWTVPYGGTVFHLGVHNIPPRTARDRVRILASYSAQPKRERLGEILDWLGEDEDTLIVFNHPFWDERGLGPEGHRANVSAFLAEHRRRIHALELNGLRCWTENRQVAEYALTVGMPVISGGDRHGCEPNVLLNLTNASRFTEFVHEVRYSATSRVLVTSAYRESLVSRVAAAVADAVRENRQHGYGWTRWSERVFYKEPDRPDQEGAVIPVARLLNQGVPLLARHLAALAGILDWRGTRHAVRFVAPPLEDFGL